jgi:hypothetical protein
MTQNSYQVSHHSQGGMKFATQISPQLNFIYLFFSLLTLLFFFSLSINSSMCFFVLVGNSYGGYGGVSQFDPYGMMSSYNPYQTYSQSPAYPSYTAPAYSSYAPGNLHLIVLTTVSIETELVKTTFNISESWISVVLIFV